MLNTSANNPIIPPPPPRGEPVRLRRIIPAPQPVEYAVSGTSASGGRDRGVRQGVNPSQGAGQRPVPSPQHPLPCHTRALSTAIARPFLLSFGGPARNLGLVHSRPSSSSFFPSPAGAGLVPALPFRHSGPRAGIQKRGAAHPEHAESAPLEHRRVERGRPSTANPSRLS